MEFVVGQRWVSQAESQLGLGIIVETDGRQITVRFPAAEEDRIYAAKTAPLARVMYQQGDHFHDIEQRSLTVVDVQEMNGLLYYLATGEAGEEQLVPEPRISGTIELSSPSQRLYSGQFDKNKAFELRVATLHYRYQLQQSAARGLLGSRTNLLPHQVYIAHEVATRFAPRVLLADEVGLGKTIESGMILHHQLHTGLSQRALVIVPEALLHQWLVEMLRRFNLRFSLFDRSRYNALLESGEANPFESEQLVLCSLDMLLADSEVASNALAANWDMVIVDEAHHLAWSRDEVSPGYELVEAFSRQSQGLLLLTATPEQVGIESHFARLRLLDPSRFHDLDTFIAEQQGFTRLNDIVSTVQAGETLSVAQQQTLGEYLGEQPELSQDKTARETLVRQLLDRHGTGRVLFRNTRAAIEDFPQRRLHSYPLDTPDSYRRADIDEPLYPERTLQRNGEDWLSIDPRVQWLEDLLQQLKPEKVLLICSSANTAVDLEKHLHLNAGIRSAAFYEQLSIIERDRAAAYFADEENGAQTLICSEIGSEGRNFQFASHLVLFDLPTNPDLLEQRIGRLDRIGQRADIQIHIPFMQDSAQQYLFQWYDQGLNAFAQSFSAGLAVFEKFSDRLVPFISQSSHNGNGEDFATLLADTREHSDSVREMLHNGRDKLLELNSCNPSIADEVIEKIRASERSEVLQSYMTMLFDVFGVDHDFHSEHSLVLRPTDHMLTGYFPGLKEEGVTVTFDRDKAQQREDMQFVTWENPMVTEAMEMVLGTELGNTAIGAIKLKSIPVGTLMLEIFFAVQCAAPKQLQLHRFLPATPVRILLDSTDKDLTGSIKHSQMNKLVSHVKKSTRLAIVKQVRKQLEHMIETAHRLARKKAEPLIQQAQQAAGSKLDSEIERLQELQRLNGTVRDEEIDFFQQQKQKSLEYLEHAGIEMQALRVIINT